MRYYLLKKKEKIHNSKTHAFYPNNCVTSRNPIERGILIRNANFSPNTIPKKDPRPLEFTRVLW